MASSSLLQYEASLPLYGIGFSHNPQHPHRIATTSVLTGPSNKLLVVDAHPDGGGGSPFAPRHVPEFESLAQASLAFPATKVGFEPQASAVAAGQEEDGGRGELLATTGDMLRLWELAPTWNDNGGGGYVGRGQNGWNDGRNSYALQTRSVLTNSKSHQLALPPVTSFSWNVTAPTSIVTCSIDTTATLWDINTSQAVTQLIAHDRAVYDLSWLPQSSDIFVSVGADGSLRAFDLRQLEHSTILYESLQSTPLARIAFSNREQHMLACFGMDASKTLILDMRSPGQPVGELVGHQAPLSAIAWGSGGSGDGPSGGGWIASCADDCQVLLYDLTQPLPTAESRPSTRAQSRRPSNSKESRSPGGFSLDPPAAPSREQSPAPPGSVDIQPQKSWTAQQEVNNLAFSDDGEWIGCVSGSHLNVLRV